MGCGIWDLNPQEHRYSIYSGIIVYTHVYSISKGHPFDKSSHFFVTLSSTRTRSRTIPHPRAHRYIAGSPFLGNVDVSFNYIYGVHMFLDQRGDTSQGDTWQVRTTHINREVCACHISMASENVLQLTHSLWSPRHAPTIHDVTKPLSLSLSRLNVRDRKYSPFSLKLYKQ